MFKEFKIQNVVGSVSVGFPIRLEGIKMVHSEWCSYEPEIFPGLIFRLADPKVVLLIFVSGKVVLTGAKSEAMINKAFTDMYHVLAEFRKKEDPNVAPKLIASKKKKTAGGGNKKGGAVKKRKAEEAGLEEENEEERAGGTGGANV